MKNLILFLSILFFNPFVFSQNDINSNIKKNTTEFAFYINEIKVNGVLKRNKSQLKNAVISCRYKDKNFDFKVYVKEFSIKIPYKNSIVVSEGSINNGLYKLILQTKKGDLIVISDIKTKDCGTKKFKICISPIVIEIID